MADRIDVPALLAQLEGPDWMPSASRWPSANLYELPDGGERDE